MTSPIRNFVKREHGGITILNIYFTIVLAIIAGAAIDVASLVQARTQLQVAADSAAHAAIATREFSKLNIQPPRDKAKEVAAANVPSNLGSVLNDADINFGTYDRTKKQFTIDNTSFDAVHIVTDRLATNNNAVPAFLLRLIGFKNFDLRTSSVFETFYPTCLREGFVAEARVDMQSGNGFYNGFCIHSNTQVEINNGNTCEPGVIISVPGYLDDFVIPNNKVTSNPGCQDAVRAGSYDIKILDRINNIEAGVNDPLQPDYYRTFLTNNTVNNITLGSNNNQLEFSDLRTLASLSPAQSIEGRVYKLNCTNPSGKIQWKAAQTWQKIVVITNCKVDFVGGPKLEEMTLIVTNSTSDSISASAGSNGVTFGKADGCTAGGETQVVTHGSIDIAAKLSMYGSQIIAADNVTFAANANGIHGASIIAGGEIDGTSNASMAFCGNVNTVNFQAAYFRLAG